MATDNPGPYVAHPPLGAAPGGYGMPAPLAPFGAPGFAPGAWIWRTGNLLCFRAGAQLPMVCPKTNVPTNQTATINFIWRPTWAYLLLLLGLLPYLIAVAVTQKTARVVVPLAPEIIKRRKIGGVLAGLGFVFFFVSLFGGATSNNGQLFGVALLVGILALFGGLTAMLIMARTFKVVRITSDTIVVLDGVHPGYLAQMPEGPLPTFQ